MIRGQLLRLWIKQAVHTGLAKVPHHVSVWERAVCDAVLSQNGGLSGFLSCYSKLGQVEAVPCKNLLLPLQCPPNSPCYLCLFPYPGLPSPLKSPSNGELTTPEETYASEEYRDRCCVDWGGPPALHTACVSWAYAGKRYVILRSITKEVPVGQLNCAA